MGPGSVRFIGHVPERVGLSRIAGPSRSGEVASTGVTGC
jgi:hypothetical protein